MGTVHRSRMHRDPRVVRRRTTRWTSLGDAMEVAMLLGWRARMGAR